MRVVETGSFTLAAEKLGMSKATVSKHVTALEKHLDSRLLNRTTRTLRLTEVGANFYVHCQKAMGEMEAAEAEVSRSSTEPRGRLRISAPTPFGCRPVASVLGEFMDRYPDIQIDLVLSDHIADLNREGFDLAIRITRREPSRMLFRLLASCVFIVCAAPSYCERYGMPRVPSDLTNHHCLICAHGAIGDNWGLEGPNGRETVTVAGRLRINNCEALRLALLSGLGIGLMPTFLVADDIRAGRLCNVLPAYQESGYSIFAVYSSDSHAVPKVQAFIDHLEAHFRQSPF